MGISLGIWDHKTGPDSGPYNKRAPFPAYGFYSRSSRKIGGKAPLTLGSLWPENHSELQKKQHRSLQVPRDPNMAEFRNTPQSKSLHNPIYFRTHIIHIRIFVCIYLCLHACMYVCICMCIYPYVIDIAYFSPSGLSRYASRTFNALSVPMPSAPEPSAVRRRRPTMQREPEATEGILLCSYNILYYIIIYYIIFYSILFYSIILYYIILSYIILYSIVLYYIMLY